MTTHRRVRTRLLASAVPMLLAGGTTLVTGAARADEDETVTRLAPVMVEARQWTEDVRRTPGTVDLLTPEERDWVDHYHACCREILSARLAETGDTQATDWLERHTQPL